MAVKIFVKIVLELELYPIGDIAFVFSKKSRRNGKKIVVSDVKIHQLGKIDTLYTEQLTKAMKENTTDLLTDGYKFYTLVSDSNIARIEHEQFDRELKLHKLLY